MSPEESKRDEEITKQPIDQLVQKIASLGSLPAIASHIQELMAISSNEKASLSQYANVILKNVSLTAKLLRLVNTVYFFQRNPVHSVSQAIRILGWNTIRDVAASIIFLSDFGKKSQKVGELLQLSVLTAYNAMEISKRCNYPRAEEAYLCGMFSVFGELMVATYLPDEYAKILAVSKSSIGELQSASREVIGFTFGQFGAAMLKQWGMPEKLALGTQPLQNNYSHPATEEQWLSLIATFSHELTDKAFRDPSGKGYTAWLASFLSTYGSYFHITDKNVGEIFEQSFAQTEKAFSSVHIAFNKQQFDHLIKDSQIITVSVQSTGQLVDETAELNKDLLRQFSLEIDSVLHSGEHLEVNDIVAIIMEAIYRGAGFDRVLFCLTDQKRTHLRARLAVGEGAEELKEKFQFVISFLEGPVGPTMLRGKDIFVQDILTSNYSRSKFSKMVGARSFMMVPITVNNQIIGCLYADHITEILKIDEEDKTLLLGMRDNLSVELTTRKQ